MRVVRCESCPIRPTSIVADLPEELLADFRSRNTIAIYRRRQVVFHEETPAAGLYIVCSGLVKLFKSDRFGRDYILGIAEPGDVVGELRPDPAASYATSAEALTDSQLCFLPRERVSALVQEHPRIGLRLLETLSAALSEARRKAGALALQPAEVRLAELLARLTHHTAGHGSNGTRLAYSRREIAEMIGVTPETVTRLIGRLRQRKLIAIHGRDIEVLDRAKLTRLAGHVSSTADPP